MLTLHYVSIVAKPIGGLSNVHSMSISINKALIPKLHISSKNRGMKRSDLPWVTLYNICQTNVEIFFWKKKRERKQNLSRM